MKQERRHSNFVRTVCHFVCDSNGPSIEEGTPLESVQNTPRYQISNSHPEGDLLPQRNSK